MSRVGDKLALLRSRIDGACERAGRPASVVTLIAVSKTFPAALIEAAADAGQRRFGESYVQEALPKMAQLAERGLEWHFIGPVQSNKTRDLAAHFDWVQGVDRLKIAERLSAQRPASLRPLQVCVQVNISGEASKSGCAPDEAAALCQAIAAMPGLQLRGLMAVPAAAGDAQRAFADLRGLFEAIRQRLPALDTLSMGMSDDLEAAVAQGSTMLRVGSAIFGRRR